MQASLFLARLLGPLLLLPGIGLLINPRVFRTIATEVVGKVTLVYLFGLTDLAAGLAIVLTHNVWVASWRVLITLVGWLMLIRGAARILATDWVMGTARRSFAASSFIRSPASFSSFSASCSAISATWPDLLKGAKQ